jgi:RTX calcium-binding nonapeptide repeat (4 copies)
MGAGNDSVSIQKSTIKTGLRVDGGAGNDTLEVWKSTIHGKLEADMGAGNDTVRLTDAVFSSSYLDGGSGTDTLKRTGGKVPVKVSFEL